ncbi:hypothetical protein AMTRI_Chr10g7990 [Amborella trichopoda]|uniref:uncharacterized protein LOC105421682 n=1 Tax=Amborella trichopoda TaxID=13333 RepID=UPI0005D373C1|nr:uncharacterized protein LOC105421682 [Amborella trichopoda]|eukprot:XP_011628232.1 uncharacterized protein LOC105421682 [Amborella trichopoda]
MCCTGKLCRICTCLILLIILIGLLFGFGVFKHGFHKLKECLHDCNGKAQMSYYPPPGRPFMYNAPVPQ